MIYVIKKEDVGKDYGVFRCPFCESAHMVDLKHEIGIIISDDVGREVKKIDDVWVVETHTAFKIRKDSEE